MICVNELSAQVFGLENARDLPGLKELRAAGLLDSRPLPGDPGDDAEESDDTQAEMFDPDTED